MSPRSTRGCGERRGRWRARWLVLSALLIGTVSGAAGTPAWALFSSVVSVSGNTFGAATSFPTYPQAVTADSPVAYYREDGTAGYDTALDSASGGPLGAYGQVPSPTTIWSFDEGSGTTTADLADGASAAADPGTLEGGAGWTAGQEGDAVSLNGTSAFVQGASTSIGTNYSFSVGDWVYLTDANYATDTNIALSQDGTNVSAFELGCIDGSWAFAMPSSDSTSASIASVNGGSCSLSTWVYLAATYQDTVGSNPPVMTLYVDGQVAASGGNRPAGSEWASSGPLIAGAALWSGRTDFWHGDIDEVTTYGSNTSVGTGADVLTAGQEAALYAQSFPAPVLRYGFNELTGTATEDLSGNLDTGLFEGAATWGTGHTGTTGDGAMSVASGQSGWVQSADSGVVNTTQSFSVSAWVYLTDGTTTRTAVSEPGTYSSGFYLKYDDNNPSNPLWGFALTESDTVGPVFDEASSSATAQTDTWVFLAGVYDAANQTVSLYVNGVAQTQASNGSCVSGQPCTTIGHPVSWDATGPINIGRALWNGTWTDQWAGSIDSVQVFQRDLTPSEIADMYHGYSSGTISTGLPGALQGAQQGQQSSTAVAFNGLGNGYDPVPETDPDPFTEECWFRANGTYGGDLMGFAGGPIGTSSPQYDRLVYLDSAGHVAFGVYANGGVTLTSPNAYNDGKWHYVAATLGPAGMDLYVDGVLVASSPSTTTAQSATGYWRWGGADLASWPNAPAAFDLSGQLEEVAFYNTQLSAQQVSWHYNANH